MVKVKTQKVAPKKRKFKNQQELFKALADFFADEFKERLKDPVFLKRNLEMCGYRKDKKGNVYVVPV